MEYESKLEVVSRSFNDVKQVFSYLINQHSRMQAWVWRAVRSYDDMDNSYVRMEINSIPYWTPEEPDCDYVMLEIADILGDSGFAMLEMSNSVSPDCREYRFTASAGDRETESDQGNNIEDLRSIIYKSIDGYKELWNKDRQAEPPMPYKREVKPARTHEQVQHDNYLYRISDASVAAFRSMLEDTRDLSMAYEAFREQFEAVKSDRAKMDQQDLYIVQKHYEGIASSTGVSAEKADDNALFENVSFGTRLERAEKFSFYGKIFHIHGDGLRVKYESIQIDPKLKELAYTYEDDLRVAIARRGGIVNDFDKPRYTDCVVMVDNEDQRHRDWKDHYSSDVKHFGLELISRFAIWYAITRTPELTEEERKKLGESSFYLDAVEAKSTKVLETEKALKAEEEERERQYKLQQEKDFGEIMKLLKGKYGINRASSTAQIQKEVSLDSFTALSYWSSMERYIKKHFNMTATAYFKQEGLTGTKK